MSAADPVAALVAIALADSAIAAIAGARGFGGELPPSETRHMPRECFVVKLSGGVSLTGRSYVEHETQRVDLFAFGKTPRAADQLRAEIALVFRRVRRQVAAATLIHWIEPASGALPGREPETHWPRSFQSFQAFHALENVS